jgi:hypothetical protein
MTCLRRYAWSHILVVIIASNFYKTLKAHSDCARRRALMRVKAVQEDRYLHCKLRALTRLDVSEN